LAPLFLREEKHILTNRGSFKHFPASPCLLSTVISDGNWHPGAAPEDAVPALQNSARRFKSPSALAAINWVFMSSCAALLWATRRAQQKSHSAIPWSVAIIT